MTEPGEMVSIGHVRRAVGLDGRVEVELYSGDSSRLAAGGRVYVAGRPLAVAETTPGRKGLVNVRFEGVHDRTAAEILRGSELELPESEIPAAPDGSHYHYQIIGCSVRDTEGNTLGIVSGIMETGANDVYIVERPGNKEALIPAVDGVIMHIDTGSRVITIDPPRGLIE